MSEIIDLAGGRTEIHEPRFQLIPFDKIAFDTTPAYLVKGIMPRVGLIVVWGAPKCGKSFFVFDLVMHMALGWEYRGRRVIGPTTDEGASSSFPDNSAVP